MDECCEPSSFHVLHMMPTREPRGLERERRAEERRGEERRGEESRAERPRVSTSIGNEAVCMKESLIPGDLCSLRTTHPDTRTGVQRYQVQQCQPQTSACSINMDQLCNSRRPYIPTLPAKSCGGWGEDIQPPASMKLHQRYWKQGTREAFPAGFTGTGVSHAVYTRGPCILPRESQG